ncbi:MAG TPA: methyltransferase domain-containing protein [Steroidobacteraceae bacterium]|nr:methyltransferase domain-containing protein [Steroidobacteraceae bacterium]
MAATQVRDEDQAKRWNGSAGCAWVEAQQMLDRTLQPFEDLLIAEVSASGAQHVLDVGCGTGSMSRAIARLVGDQGTLVGVDISEQMIDAARMLGEEAHSPATFICADAQKHPFGGQKFDLIVSRFGVMFFEDSVQAFVNLRAAAADGASLRCIVWRSPAENPFMTAAERAAAPLLPNLQPRRPDAPGQFGFADDRRVRSILQESGWNQIDIRPIDVTCTLPEKEITRYGTRFGPVGIALQQADAQTRAQVATTVRAAFDPYVHGPEVRFTASCWMIAARAT